VIGFYSKESTLIFCLKLGKNISDTSAVLSGTYGGEAMKESSVFEWHKLFKDS
jgi:hypothetical protein